MTADAPFHLISGPTPSQSQADHARYADYEPARGTTVAAACFPQILCIPEDGAMAGGNGWLSGRSMAAFAGGTVAAVIASRFLPPIFAQGLGSARAAMGRDPFEALAEDHRHFVSLLTEMEESGNDETFRRTQLLLRLKRGIAAHAMAEEDVVYPLLHDEAKEEHDARHLYGEHADVKMHLHALEEMPKDDPRWVERVRALKRLIQEHARQEEEVDFPKLRQALSEQETARLSKHVAREKALLL